MRYKYTITATAEVPGSIDGLEELLKRVKQCMRVIKSDLPTMVIHPVEEIIPDADHQCVLTEIVGKHASTDADDAD